MRSRKGGGDIITQQYPPVGPPNIGYRGEQAVRPSPATRPGRDSSERSRHPPVRAPAEDNLSCADGSGFAELIVPILPYAWQSYAAANTEDGPQTTKPD